MEILRNDRNVNAGRLKAASNDRRENGGKRKGKRKRNDGDKVGCIWRGALYMASGGFKSLTFP